ncbi:MAG: hypothetical protein AAGK21_03635 [Bacteroidota bacterium]
MRALLLLAALALVALPAEAQPRRSAAPQQALSIADAPASVTVRAGGSDRNAVPGSGCSGFINNGEPTAAIEVSGDGPLAIYAVSGSDTTMLVSDPSGRWHCSDDANGSNPAVTFTQAAAGTYVVWVGTFSPDESASADLSAVRGQPAW